MTEIKRKTNPLTIVLLLSGAFFVIFLTVSAVLFMGKAPQSEKNKMGSAFFKTGSVAVVEISGVIMDSRKTLRKLERLEEDEEVKAIVVRINSPGGSVAPSQEIYEALKRSKKPVIASMGSVAASGGYYIAMGAKKVFANPGTITGSIGVIMEFANLEKLYEWAKIRRYVLKTGKFKDAGAEYREMQPEERALLQSMLDNVLLQFKTAVSDGRKIPMDRVTPIADGRIFSGSQAFELKLVDHLGTLSDAIEMAGEMGGIKGKPNVVYPERGRRKWLQMLFDDASSPDDDSEATATSRSGVSALVDAIADRVVGAAGITSVRLQPGIYWLWSGGR